MRRRRTPSSARARRSNTPAAGRHTLRRRCSCWPPAPPRTAAPATTARPVGRSGSCVRRSRRTACPRPGAGGASPDRSVRPTAGSARKTGSSRSRRGAPGGTPSTTAAASRPGAAAPDASSRSPVRCAAPSTAASAGTACAPARRHPAPGAAANPARPARPGPGSGAPSRPRSAPTRRSAARSGRARGSAVRLLGCLAWRFGAAPSPTSLINGQCCPREVDLPDSHPKLAAPKRPAAPEPPESLLQKPGTAAPLPPERSLHLLRNQCSITSGGRSNRSDNETGAAVALSSL